MKVELSNKRSHRTSPPSSFENQTIVLVLIRDFKSLAGISAVASFEGEPPLRVVDEDLVDLPRRDAPAEHLGHDVLQDVGVAVASELGEAVLGVDVVRDDHLVLVALLHEERQAGGEKSREEKSSLQTAIWG